MRNGASNQNFSVHAIAGTHVITLAFDAKESATSNLLGFAVKRKKFDKDGVFIEENWIQGYKPFESIIPEPQPFIKYDSEKYPIQSFTWGDYAISQGRKYQYIVYPVTGTPDNTALGQPLSVDIEPEPYEHPKHEIYFNRGASAIQAYVEKFKNIRPNAKSLSAQEKKERYDWLSRGLFEAVQNFIKSAKDGNYALRCAIYELDYPEVPKMLMEAKNRGVDVKIVYEARKDKDKQGNIKDNNQTKQNKAALVNAGFAIDDKISTYKRENTDGIPHNKFMVLLENVGGQLKPIQVWTGSTNLSEGGIFGHSNVGHLIKDEELATQYYDYWQMLVDDPDKETLKTKVTTKWPNVSLANLPKNKMTPIFSPREGTKMLQFYADLFGNAQKTAAITLPFNLDEKFEKIIEAPSDATQYIILNSGKTNIDIAEKLSKDPSAVVIAGSKLDNNFGQWLAEINPGLNGSNVQYIHSKYLIIDPLGAEPYIITGSANFSVPSTNKNDENMVIIPCSSKKRETRVQDIYLGEFFRIIDHLYSRYLASLDKSTEEEKRKRRFLKETPAEWVASYFKAGSDKAKRREAFSFGFGV